MFKAIKALLSVTNSALDVTTSVLNEVNTGLNSMNTSLQNYSERRSFLKELCRLIYENKLNRNDAIKQIQEKIGDEYISEFYNDLERYCETECKTAVYKIFPTERPSEEVEKYFSENNETLFRQYLENKYGTISQKYFQAVLEERKKWLTNYLKDTDNLLKKTDGVSSYKTQGLSNNELTIAFWDRFEEVEKKFKEIDEEFDKKVGQLFGENDIGK